MIEEILDKLEESIKDVNKKFYGVTVGKVINPLDPMLLGRVQVQLPFIDSLDLSPWARVAVPMAGPAHGFYFIPNINDEVLVAFEHGDISAPYIIGSLWNAMAPPPLPSPIPQIRMIRTLVGNQIVFTEIPPTITINTPAGQTILLSPAGVQIMSDPKDIINITPAGIQIMSGANLINLTPDGITISGTPNLNLTAPGAINITAGGAVSITAPLVKIN